jgi:hypothetical protein
MDDHARVAELLGRTPQGAFDVVVRDAAGDPVVVRNAPFLDDGTPMPTRYYLVGTDVVRAVSRLEADGGVRAAEAAIDADDIAAAHLRYAAERDAAIPDDHTGPRPSGGVGGTRVGVKCLHAHVAYALAGGDDPVGRWTLDRLDAFRNPAPTAAGAPGTLILTVDDHRLVLTIDGRTHELPIGPRSLLDGPLGTSDPPLPMDLTNALGLVQDHLDDAIIADPAVGAPHAVAAHGTHAQMLARVELGTDRIPDGYELRREDADEVFRTLALEPLDARSHNPGLDPAHAESIVATCCVILGVMRRLDLRSISIPPADHAADGAP